MSIPTRAAARKETMATLTGKTIGNYLIQEELGRGAMGVVFKAKQLSMDRVVALKFLPTRLAQNEKVVQRFLREAKAAGKLAHPHVVGVHDAGQMEGLYFIAMEYVDGNSVHSHIRQSGPYSEKVTLDISGQIAEALKMAHGRGILHRDIKPDNFLIDTAGRARLADLGLARFEGADGSNEAELTQNGTALGTPHYMAPEQCKGEKIDARADLYSLGVSMYVMSTGQTPFDGPNGPSVMVKVLTEAPRPIKQWNPKLTPGFIAVIEKMMHKDPARRFQDAGSILQAIEEVKSGTYKPVTGGHAKVTRNAAHETVPDPVDGSAPVAASPSKVRLAMYGAGAAVLALVLVGMALRSRTPDKPVALVEPAPLPPAAIEKPAPDDKKPVAIVPTDKPVSPIPAVVADPEVLPPDAKPEMIAAMQAWRSLRAELMPLLHKNPRHVIEKIGAFQKQHSFQRTRLGATAMLNEAHEAQSKLEARWTSTQEYIKEQMAAGRRGKAFFALLEFSEAHATTSEAVEAKALLGKMIDGLRRESSTLAESGEFDKAEEMLTASISKMPDDLAAPLKVDLEKLRLEQAQQKVLADADAKRLNTLLETAYAQCREPDAVSGKRYDFATAAHTLKEGAESLKGVGAKKEAEGLAVIFTRAAELFGRMRGKTTELQSLGRYGAGQLMAWEDRGLSFKPAGLSQAQSVPWKAVTGENLVQIAQATRTIPGRSATDLFNMGALAFAAGSNTLACEKFEEAVKLDEKLKSLAEAPLHILKPAPSTDRESLARSTFAAATAAHAKKDRDGLQKAVQLLAREYADTQFVKTHTKELQELSVPSTSSEEPVVAVVPEKVKEISEKPAEKKDDLAAIGAAELKKAGWSEIKGTWLPDPKTKGLYNVVGGGHLYAAQQDGQVKVRFMLEEGATIGVYVRHPPENEIQKSIRRKIENNNLVGGPGYGVQVEGGVATYFGDKNTGASLGPALRQMFDKYPLKVGSAPMGAGIHSASISIKGESLEISVDDRIVARSATPLRTEGDIVIIIDGNARIQSPTVSK